MTYAFILFLATILQPTESFRLAVARPFSHNDAERSLDFTEWTTFHPCDPNETAQFDLVLSFSGHIDYGRNKLTIKPLITKLLEKFNSNNQSSWMSCFSQIIVHNSNIPSYIDLYLPEQADSNPHWVLGPNQQFITLYKWFAEQSSYYNVWFLMEADARPVKPGFLSTLVREIKSEQPFAILGSRYRGDRWDQLLHLVNPALKFHINGNAVYNCSSPILSLLYQKLVNLHESNRDPSRTPESTNSLVSNNLATLPYDYIIAQLIYQSDLLYQQSLAGPESNFYKGWSQTIGNYASTHLIADFLGDESIIHGAKLLNKNTDYRVALLVSDWGLGYIDTFHESILNSDHPFLEVIYIVPEKNLPNQTIFNITAASDSSRNILIRYVSRGFNQDYLDLCLYQPVTTNLFMKTDTYQQLTTLSYLYVDALNQLVVNYIPRESKSCQTNAFCRDSLSDSDRYLSVFFNKNISLQHSINNMNMIYNTDILGSLNNRNILGSLNNQNIPSQELTLLNSRQPLPLTYCQIWAQDYLETRQLTEFPTCIPYPGLTASGYYGFLQQIGNHNREVPLSLSNLIANGDRQLFLPRYLPSANISYCEKTSQNVVELPLISICHQYSFDESICNSIPNCWFRPKFSRCIELFNIQSVSNLSSLRSSRQDISDIDRYPSSYRQAPCEDSSKKGWVVTSYVLVAVLGGLLLLSLIGLPLLFLGLIYTNIGIGWMTSLHQWLNPEMLTTLAPPMYGPVYTQAPIYPPPNMPPPGETPITLPPQPMQQFLPPLQLPEPQAFVHDVFVNIPEVETQWHQFDMMI